MSIPERVEWVKIGDNIVNHFYGKVYELEEIKFPEHKWRIKLTEADKPYPFDYSVLMPTANEAEARRKFATIVDRLGAVDLLQEREPDYDAIPWPSASTEALQEIARLRRQLKAIRAAATFALSALPNHSPADDIPGGIVSVLVSDLRALRDAIEGAADGPPAPAPTVEDMLELYNLGFDVEEAFKGITRKNTSADSWSIRQELLAAWQPLARKIRALRFEFVPEAQGTEGVDDG